MRRLIAAGSGVAIIVIAAVLLWPASTAGLVLYAALDYAPAMGKAFTKKTGIPVRVIRLSTGALLARITAEGNHPDWDIGWFDGATAAVSLDQAGLLAHGLRPPVQLTATGRAMLPPDGAYVPTGFTLAGVFVMNKSSPLPPPTTWDDLAAPPYHGVVGMNDPAISGPTYPALAGMLKLTVIYPRPAYVLPNVIVLPKGLHGRALREAKAFIAFAESPAGQAIRKREGEGDSYYWPVTALSAPRHALPALPTLDLATLDAARWGAREKTVLAWFAHAIDGAGS
ncbi:MAG: iron ABC transporter substrate-binding protein [Acidiphilium sp. 37-67-22]|nr:MAG: iron ABC transporter substrate-binding protein [Acidiphilium sp. 37-67-22]